MEKKLNALIEKTKNDLANIKTNHDLLNLKANILGKKSEFNDLMIELKSLNSEEKPKFGKMINEAKQEIAALIESKRVGLEVEKIQQKLAEERIDITLPGRKFNLGRKHVLTKTIEEIEDIFIGLGYTIKEGPEVETDLYNFEMLNLPKDHPAREMQDSLYINEELLLRTHMKIEALVVDKSVTLADLKGTLLLIAKKLFGENRQIRLRPSYFPFTEPSVEVDVSCFICNGNGCSMCKNTGWIEILGAGMVNNNVLRQAGYDPEVYQGFALGMGIERIAMLKYGIDDIRLLYANDLRFNSQF
jgi:phenylalanyl-tRNA synthetase alpha chain